MLALNIQNSIVCFRNIVLHDLPKILEWYNKVDDFKFATGIDKPISLSVLRQKYAEVVISSREFFVGIYELREGKLIGLLKGRLQNRNDSTVWISSIVIDPLYQHCGYGSSSIELLLGHFKSNNNVKKAYLAVIEDNFQGRAFWFKHKFCELRKIENHLKLNDKQQNVIIMQKSL